MAEASNIHRVTTREETAIKQILDMLRDLEKDIAWTEMFTPDGKRHVIGGLVEPDAEDSEQIMFLPLLALVSDEWDLSFEQERG